MIEPSSKNKWAAPLFAGFVGLAIGTFAGIKLAPEKTFQIGGQPGLEFMAQNRFVSKAMYDSQEGLLTDVDDKLKNGGAIDFIQWAELLKKHRFAFACTDGPCDKGICCGGVNVTGYFISLFDWKPPTLPTCTAPTVEVFDQHEQTIQCPSGWEIKADNSVVIIEQALMNCNAYRLDIVCGNYRYVGWRR